MKAPEKIAVIGAGLMGCSVAQVFAATGRQVSLYDTKTDIDPLSNIENNIRIMQDGGVADETYRDTVLAHITFGNDLKKAVENAGLVVECVFEALKLKQDVFAEIEALCGEDTILATNTSVMSPTEISQHVKHKERFIGMHFWNPGHLIPLVELVLTADTDTEVANACEAVLKEAGKMPVICKKDVPGFIANRLQHALWREAISIVEHGIADAETVDLALKHGPGLRLPQLAPLENADMVGLDLTLNIHNYVLQYLEDSHEPSPLLKEKVAKGELGFKSGGNGFYELDEQQMKEKREGLQKYLIHTLKEQGSKE